MMMMHLVDWVLLWQTKKLTEVKIEKKRCAMCVRIVYMRDRHTHTQKGDAQNVNISTQVLTTNHSQFSNKLLGMRHLLQPCKIEKMFNAYLRKQQTNTSNNISLH